jgi:hypothetical protein
MRLFDVRFLAALILSTAATASAQVAVIGIPRIDAIEFYGLHQVTPELARQALGLSPGSPLPPSKGDAEQRLLDIDRVIGARLEAVCCEGGNTLYVGLEERDAPRFDTHSAPGGAVLLPDEVWVAYQAGRSAQFPTLAAKHQEALRDVLRESADELHRLGALTLLAQAANKADIIEDLRAALTDNDPAVRRQAIRTLTALRVPGAWFIDLLQSIAWSDRIEAARSLELLTRDRDVLLLSRIEGATLDALIEMSRWRTEAHAYPAFLLVGRTVGLADLDIRDAWLRGGRATVIEQARRKKR